MLTGTTLSVAVLGRLYAGKRNAGSRTLLKPRQGAKWPKKSADRRMVSDGG